MNKQLETYVAALELAAKGITNGGEVKPENFGTVDYVLTDEEIEHREYLETEKLVTAAGKAMGFNITYSDNVGDFSRGESYTPSDKRFNPLHHKSDAFEVMFKLEINISFNIESLSITASKGEKHFTFSGESKQDAFCKAVTHLAASFA